MGARSVVSGSVNTDNFVVHTPDGTVLSSQTADKAVMTVYAEQHTQEVPVQPSSAGAGTQRIEAAELAASGIRIEEHFGAPQDIEWARANGHLHRASSAYHRPPGGRGTAADRLERARAHRHVRPGQHCRAAA